MITPVVIELGFAALAGAIIGSFLTVVAARVPPLVLESPGGRVRLGKLFQSLSWPGSHCGHCHTALRWRDNIPFLGFLLLRGQCRTCHHSIGWRYLALEFATAIAAVVCAMTFAWTAQAAMAFTLLAFLIALCAIDFAEMLLPDILVLPLLPLGLAYQHLYGNGLMDGLLGAAGGFGLLWLIGALYRRSRSQEGLGGGDIKLAAALGAWVGLSALPWFLMLAFASGLLGMGFPVLLKRTSATSPVPFGPFLALSGALLVLWPEVATSLSRLVGA